MAGGFGGRGAPLHARTRAGAPATAPPGAAPPGVPGPPYGAREAAGAGCPARHVWVTVPVDGGAPRAGLLLEWRRGDDGWEGRVVYAAELRTGHWAAVEEWLPASVVTPLGSPS